MDQICLVMPILPGRADYARDFIGELDAGRLPEYARSEQRVGIDKEVWFLASGPHDVVLVAYIEAADFASALEQLSSSEDEFDLWFKRGLVHATGIDLNNPAVALPELLSAYSASTAVLPR